MRYVDPLLSAGEPFIYSVEQSTDLQTWTSTGLTLEKVVQMGAGMERTTWVTDNALLSGKRRFLRLRVTLP